MSKGMIWYVSSRTDMLHRHMVIASSQMFQDNIDISKHVCHIEGWSSSHA